MKHRLEIFLGHLCKIDRTMNDQENVVKQFNQLNIKLQLFESAFSRVSFLSLIQPHIVLPTIMPHVSFQARNTLNQ